MAETALICRDGRRCQVLRCENACDTRWNGIDYVEVVESRDEARTTDMITVCLLCEVPPDLIPGQFTLHSDVLRKPVPVKFLLVPQHGICVQIETGSRLCPQASYTLTIRRPSDFDPQFSNYTFIATSPVTDVDPKYTRECPPRKRDEPQINYLARDYSSFRQMLLDRLALTMPEWTERHIPDLGMTLVEIFAYVGDYLAYQQDAVATEAYLHTARKRISVQRHARLVDYQLDEGCNARTFVQMEVEADTAFDPEDVFFITEHPDSQLKKQAVLPITSLERVPTEAYQPFEVVRETMRCRQLECNDITNITGLIAYFLKLADDSDKTGQSHGAARKLSNYIWKSLPPDLRIEVADYAKEATAQPPGSLAENLCAGLNAVLQQHCLASQVSPGELRACKTCGTLPASLALNSIETNLALFRRIFADFVARYDDRQIELYSAHNEMTFYTWSQSECCLPVNTTRATLLDAAGSVADWIDFCAPCLPPPIPYEDPPPAPAAKKRAGLPDEQQPGETDDAPPEEASDPFVPESVECSDYVMAHDGEWNLRHLSPGDVLIFEEVVGPQTHHPADADPAHRQAVRLTRVNFCIDPVTQVRVVEIEWGPDDALRFPLCISSIGPAELGCRLETRVSVARGNVMLVDHGKRLDDLEWLGETQTPRLSLSCTRDDDDSEKEPREPATTRSELFRPVLQELDLTWAAPLKPCDTAWSRMKGQAHEGLPAIRVFGLPIDDSSEAERIPGKPPYVLVNFDDITNPLLFLKRLPSLSDDQIRRVESLLPAPSARQLQDWRISLPDDREFEESAEYRQFTEAFRASLEWKAQRHLLDSTRDDRHFIIETDNDARARLRFGDDDLGRRPPPQTSYYAQYRVGRGSGGMVGADKIRHLVYRQRQVSALTGVRNPLPAAGAVEPETTDHARQHAPQQFRKQRRAITADDYATIVRRDFATRVLQARAMLHWMGMWYEVSVAIDPRDNVRDVSVLIREIKAHLERHRRINHILRVELPRYVPLDIALTICVVPGHLNAHVEAELLDRFGTVEFSDGTKGLFHPDNVSFGNALYLSRVVLEARMVEGVENVSVTRFRRHGQGDQGELDAGVIEFGPLEIPRLDNDGLRPENGRLCLDMRGDR
jgi:predicted phage baseplate assembly protein